jgi:[ribosomal protein S5]-alanine N-acetyltransferase
MNIGIREYQPTDLTHIKKLATEDSVQRSMAFPRPTDAEAWERYVEERQGNHSKILIILQQDEFVGFITLKGNAIPEIFQVTYCIASQWQNMGYATSALELCLPVLFQGTGCIRLQAFVEPHNSASCRVLEKCGFTQEGLLRRSIKMEGELVDAYLYALLKTDIDPSSHTTA